MVVSIVRGAWGWKGLGGPKGPPGRPGGPQLYCYLLHFGHFDIGDAPGPLGRCVWPLRTSPGSSRRHFGDVLGPLGELWEHFLGAFLE